MRAPAEDEHPLRLTTKPENPAPARRTLRTVDLFAGCGGLSLGAETAARAMGRQLDVRLAVDFEKAATNVYRANFPNVRDLRTADVADIFAPHTAETLTEDEQRLARSVGRVHILMGGPPCQGHSNLNNHTRRNDPKNALYLYMARAAEVFRPSVVLVENVPAVRHDTFDGANVVATASQTLKALGYEVDTAVIPLVDLGVAQQRKRHILLATTAGLKTPSDVFEAIDAAPSPHRDIRWAIGDLNRADGTGWDEAPRASEANKARMQYLITSRRHNLPNDLRPVCHQGDHSYVSMYGRLKWTDPAQTITSGFGSIGQGRYMHPGQKRALTAHEAARLQGFPDYFDFSACVRKTDLATMIGNAVPPQLAERVIHTVFD